MARNFLLRWIHRYGERQRLLGIRRCEDWAGAVVTELVPDSLLDVGCGDGSLILRYLRERPRDLCGIEGASHRQKQAQERGLQVFSFDLNGRWPFEDNRFEVVFASQVIEHVHNTRLFLEEIRRVLKPGGTAVVASENLCSLLNWMALTMGYAPFSLMQICGRYVGNPIGLHEGEPIEELVPIDHPAFPGVAGHIRVLTVRQARELFEWLGFELVEVRSISIMPIPDFWSRWLERWILSRGHFLLVRARKPR